MVRNADSVFAFKQLYHAVLWKVSTSSHPPPPTATGAEPAAAPTTHDYELHLSGQGGCMSAPQMPRVQWSDVESWSGTDMRMKFVLKLVGGEALELQAGSMPDFREWRKVFVGIIRERAGKKVKTALKKLGAMQMLANRAEQKDAQGAVDAATEGGQGAAATTDGLATPPRMGQEPSAPAKYVPSKAGRRASIDDVLQQAAAEQSGTSTAVMPSPKAEKEAAAEAAAGVARPVEGDVGADA